MPDTQDSRLVMFHCPVALCEEMDALCEYNMVDRTDFLLQAIHAMLNGIESRQKAVPAAESTTLPGSYPEEDEDDVLLAAEDSED